MRRSLERLARSMRGSIGNLRAASEALELYPGAAPEHRARLLAVLATESERLAGQVETLERLVTQRSDAPASRTETTLDALLETLARAARGAGLECELQEVMPPFVGRTALSWDLTPLVTATAALFAELRRDLAVGRCSLRARAAERFLLIDIAWSDPEADIQRLYSWHSEALEPVTGADGGATRGGLRGAARDLDGEAWFNLDRDGEAARVRILLPLGDNIPIDTD